MVEECKEEFRKRWIIGMKCSRSAGELDGGVQEVR